MERTRSLFPGLCLPFSNVCTVQWYKNVDAPLGFQVSIEVPSIKATLSDREYDLITSIAGDNFKEEQQVPKAALWLEHHLLNGDESEDEEEETPGGFRYVRVACAHPLQLLVGIHSI